MSAAAPGETTLALAEAVGRAGRAVGLDISAPLVERARQRLTPELAARTAFRVGDAQTDGAGGRPLRPVVSRFGLMFFADPVGGRSATSRRRCGPAAGRSSPPGRRIGDESLVQHPARDRRGAARRGAAAAARARRGRSASPTARWCSGSWRRPASRTARLRTERIMLRQAASPAEAGAFALRIGPSALLMRERNGTAEDAAAIAAAVAARMAGNTPAPTAWRSPASVNFFTAVRPPAPQG